MAKRKKTDTEVMFPEVTYDFSIGKVIVRPFSYGDIIDLSPQLDEILRELQAREIQFNVMDDMTVDITTFLSIYLYISKPALPILARVTGLPEDSIRKLTVGESAQLIITIIQQNLETLMRFFAQLFGDSKRTPKSVKEKAEEAPKEEVTT